MHREHCAYILRGKPCPGRPAQFKPTLSKGRLCSDRQLSQCLRSGTTSGEYAAPIPPAREVVPESERVTEGEDPAAPGQETLRRKLVGLHSAPVLLSPAGGLPPALVL